MLVPKQNKVLNQNQNKNNMGILIGPGKGKKSKGDLAPAKRKVSKEQAAQVDLVNRANTGDLQKAAFVDNDEARISREKINAAKKNKSTVASFKDGSKGIKVKATKKK